MDELDLRTSLSRRLFYWWADHPLMHIIVLVAVSALAIIGYYDPSIVRNLFVEPPKEVVHDNSQKMVAPTTARDTKRPPPNVQPFRVAAGEVVVVVTCDDFFTPTNMKALRKAVTTLQELPQVSYMLWIDNIPGMNLFGLPEPILPRGDATTQQLELARQRASENPLAVGQLISADGKTLLLHISIDWLFATTDEACTNELRTAAEEAVAQVEGAEMKFQVTGRAPLYMMMSRNHLRDSWRYQLIGYSIMVLTALILFRGFAAVTIVAVAPAMGVFWTLGMIRFFQLENNPFNDVIVPVLVSLVGIADAVHLMVEIRHQRAAGLETPQAARIGVARVGMACALTSLTTAIGFASLAWAHHASVREFGWSCVLGVMMTFISVLTVVPLGCRSILGNRLHVGLGTSLIDRQLKRIEPVISWILARSRAMAWIGIGATAVLAIVCSNLKPDEKRYSGLSESAEAAKALRHLDKSLGGLEFGFVRVSWGNDVEETEVLTVLDEVDHALRTEPLIGNPLGLTSLLYVLPGEGPAEERMSLLELLPPSLKRAFYVPENRNASIQFRVQDIGIAQYGPVFERIEKRLADIHKKHPHFAMHLDGDAVWRWRDIFQIVTDLATSLGTASIVIWIVLTIVYRSIRIGLISIVPNLFPLVATGMILYFSGQYLEIVTVCVFTICVGIAVDDTIHFLTRYTEEASRNTDRSQAIKDAFSGVGSALVMTTAVLVTGMVTAIFGDARDARIFGTMGAITLSSALFADLIFLPALLDRFAPKKKELPETFKVDEG